MVSLWQEPQVFLNYSNNYTVLLWHELQAPVKYIMLHGIVMTGTAGICSWLFMSNDTMVEPIRV